MNSNSDFKIIFPYYITKAVNILNKNGFSAFAVGGCVRDSLLENIPHDWDLTTNASPCETEKCFKQYFPVIKTGTKHGTITVMIQGSAVEITTFRQDGGYTGHRRPEQVKFVGDLKTDLERRDFTVNAMAYSKTDGLIDPFDGKSDLENRIIRCVGEAETRFDEDALRILRALRFSSVLGFGIDEKTSEAIFAKKELLKFISAERILSELLKLLCGKNAADVLLKYRSVIAVIIPEIVPMFDFPQKNLHHCYDVYTHTVYAVKNIPPDPILRMTMLLHDIGKPECFCEDENGVGHFHGHVQKSAETAKLILKRLKTDKRSSAEIISQISEHDNRFPSEEKDVKRFIARHGYDFFTRHLLVRTADTLAQSDFLREKKLSELNLKKELGEKIKAQNCCLSLKDLTVNGNDIALTGAQGKEIGKILKILLEGVIDGRLKNEKSELLAYAKKIANDTLSDNHM